MSDPLALARTELRRRVGSTNLKARRTAGLQWVRAQARQARNRQEVPGVTIATVSWNSLSYLEVLVDAVRQFTPNPIEILVVDNHSSDGTKEFLASTRDVTSVDVPLNLGHGLGLDIAFLHARTEHVVVLDVDAFPIRNGWLDVALDPLHSDAKIAGAQVHRSFVHPCFLAMKRRTFLDSGSSFAPVGRAPKMGQAPKGIFMDVGEALSHNIALTYGSSAVHQLEPTSIEGPGMAGTVFADAVYHNFYSTQGNPELMSASAALWANARARYLQHSTGP